MRSEKSNKLNICIMLIYLCTSHSFRRCMEPKCRNWTDKQYMHPKPTCIMTNAQRLIALSRIILFKNDRLLTYCHSTAHLSCYSKTILATVVGNHPIWPWMTYDLSLCKEVLTDPLAHPGLLSHWSPGILLPMMVAKRVPQHFSWQCWSKPKRFSCQRLKSKDKSNYTSVQVISRALWVKIYTCIIKHFHWILQVHGPHLFRWWRLILVCLAHLIVQYPHMVSTWSRRLPW